jgi:hypothetical protein
MKAFLIIGFVVAVMLGGILALRSSARTGMPSEDVLRRATQRARELEAQEKKDD